MDAGREREKREKARRDALAHARTPATTRTIRVVRGLYLAELLRPNGDSWCLVSGHWFVWSARWACNREMRRMPLAMWSRITSRGETLELRPNRAHTLPNAGRPVGPVPMTVTKGEAHAEQSDLG